MNGKVAIIVVTYNRIKLLHENIQAILEQSYTNFDLFIIDNASTDGTKDEVEKYFSDERVKYINTGSNIGGAGGFSFGIKKAWYGNYEYCWVMDDDAIPEKNCLKILMDSAVRLNNNFSYLACVVNWIDGSICKMNATPIQSEKIFSNKDAYINGLLPIESCSFVGCFIYNDLAKKLGLPIKEFFIYGDDAEYTLRLGKEKQGYVCLNSIIVHKMGANTRIGIAEAPEERLERYKFEYRNRVYIYTKRCGYKMSKVYYLYIKECAKIVLRSKSKKIERLKIVLGGLKSGKKFNPDIEYPYDKK